MRAVVPLMLVAVLAGSTPASAQPPVPPPNPSDQDLQSSRDAVAARAAEVGRLTKRVVELDQQAAVVEAELAERKEVAFQRLLDLQAAQDAAALAARRAEEAGIETTAAATAADGAQQRLDAFAAATYQQTIDLGPLGLLTEARSPDELVARAELTDLIALEQLRVLEGLRLAGVDKVNTESTARAAREEAVRRQAAAEQAKVAADGAVGAAAAAVAEQERRLRELDVLRAAVEQELDRLRVNDAGLRTQRERYVDYQRRAAVAAEEARRRAELAAAADAAALGAPPNQPPRDIDDSIAQLGPQYQCRSGVPRWGPVKPWVSDAGQLLRCRFGIGSVGGVGPRPNVSDHPLGLALDFFVDRATGDALADCALRNQRQLSITYVIWRQRINSGSGWRMMEDRGSYVANHMEHVHISFRPSPGGSLAGVRC